MAADESFGLNNLDILYCSGGTECLPSDYVSDYTDQKNVLYLAKNDDANLTDGWTSNVPDGSGMSSECDNKKLIGGY